MESKEVIKILEECAFLVKRIISVNWYYQLTEKELQVVEGFKKIWGQDVYLSLLETELTGTAVGVLLELVKSPTRSLLPVARLEDKIFHQWMLTIGKRGAFEYEAEIKNNSARSYHETSEMAA